MDINDPIITTVEEIRKVLNIENVVGEVIETEDKIMIPVTRMGMGFGAGRGEGEGHSNPGSAGSGAGAGAGGCAAIEPIAMVIVFKGQKGPDGVKVLPLKSANPVSRAIGELGSVAVDVMSEYLKCHNKKTEETKDDEAESESKE